MEKNMENEMDIGAIMQASIGSKYTTSTYIEP